VSVTADVPDDMPEFDLGEIERYLADQAPPPAPPTPPSTPDSATGAGRTRRVRRLANQVAEAHHLVALQGATVLLSAHTPRVLRTIHRGAEAVKLVQLRQNPAFAALAAIRARRFVTTTGLSALIIALGWSTAGVQAFAASGAPRFSAAWWFAWAVEPFVSLALLTVVITRAFLASRGQPITAPTVRRVEWLFLAMTLLMNTWLHLPGVAHPFQFGQLIIHTLGPIVAVCVVTVLPLLWAAIDQTPTPHPSVHAGLSTSDRTELGMQAELRAQERLAAAIARTEQLVRDGQLPPHPSASQIQKTLGGAMDTARAVRDALRTSRDPPTTP
jgi:hypothetical protein